MKRAILLLLAAVCLRAEVVNSAANGFTVRTTLEIKAAPADVYQRITRDIGKWWSKDHTFSGDPANLSIDARPMGCFCEKLPDGGGVRFMEVVLVAPGKRIVLSGALGPLITLATSGTMEISLTPAEGGTKLQMTYSVTGYLATGFQSWAPTVDKVLAEQFTRLKNYIEHGDAAPKP